MSFDLPDSDTVYITGLPPDTTEESLAEYFGSIGVIKIDKKTRGKKVGWYESLARLQIRADKFLSCRSGFIVTNPLEH